MERIFSDLLITCYNSPIQGLWRFEADNVTFELPSPLILQGLSPPFPPAHGSRLVKIFFQQCLAEIQQQYNDFFFFPNAQYYDGPKKFPPFHPPKLRALFSFSWLQYDDLQFFDLDNKTEKE